MKLISDAETEDSITFSYKYMLTQRHLQFWELTKHIEQVKSISSLIESKSSQESDGLPSLITREQPSKRAGPFPELAFVSLILMWKAISSHNHGDWRISMCIFCACDLKACP